MATKKKEKAQEEVKVQEPEIVQEKASKKTEKKQAKPLVVEETAEISMQNKDKNISNKKIHKGLK